MARTQQRADEYKRHDRASSHAETMRSKRGVRTGHQRGTPCNTQPGFLTGLSMLLNKIQATDKTPGFSSFREKLIFFFFTMCETQLFFSGKFFSINDSQEPRKGFHCLSRHEIFLNIMVLQG